MADKESSKASAADAEVQRIEDEKLLGEDNSTEVQRDRRERIRKIKAKKINLRVPWGPGVTINGTEYKGVVTVDEETAGQILSMCSARQEHEILGRYGDGNPGLHSLGGLGDLGKKF